MITMGKKYQTRDGRAVRILATDMKNPHTVVGIVTPKNGLNEFAEAWTSNGESLVHDMGIQNDLVPVPTKHEGWVVLSGRGDKECPPYGNRVYADEVTAEIACGYFLGEHIVHVTWED